MGWGYAWIGLWVAGLVANEVHRRVTQRRERVRDLGEICSTKDLRARRLELTEWNRPKGMLRHAVRRNPPRGGSVLPARKHAGSGKP